MESQPKRMRLGTKSCTECRRRKVKCIFTEGKDMCRQCNAHKAACRPQQPPSRSSSPSTLIDGSQSDDGQAEAFRRLECQRLGLPPDTSLNAIFTRIVSDSASPRSPSSDKDLDASGALENAPLMKNLREALPTQPIFQTELRPQSQAFAPGMITTPSPAALVSIFVYTRQFWAIWPLASTVTEKGERVFPDSVPMALNFVEQSLRHRSPGVVARCLVWLSICLQELPKDFNKDTPLQLQMKASDLIAHYIEQVDRLLQANSSPVCSLDFLEAFALQYELFIFMGRPCSAWKSTRTALNNAMILGLQAFAPTPRKKEIWNTLWVQDRHLSLFLGLPYAVPEHFLNLHEADPNEPLESKILQRVAIISGHITDRNSHQLESSYASTARIMEEMDQLRDMIPTSWWMPSESNTTGVYSRDFMRRAIILFYFTTKKMLHLPYVRMAARDKRYSYSQATAFESAEGMVQAYLTIRALGTTRPMSCDFVDFVAFSGAAILAADLISKNTPRSAEEEERLWDLIMELAQNMRTTASVLDCAVARQSAEVLEHLHAARHGTYTGPESYEVTIPYFGRVRITQVEMLPPDLAQNVIEFETNVFNIQLPTDLQASCELTDNWESGWDFECTYEWQDAFNFDQVGS